MDILVLNGLKCDVCPFQRTTPIGKQRKLKLMTSISPRSWCQPLFPLYKSIHHPKYSSFPHLVEDEMNLTWVIGTWPTQVISVHGLEDYSFTIVWAHGLKTPKRPVPMWPNLQQSWLQKCHLSHGNGLIPSTLNLGYKNVGRLGISPFPWETNNLTLKPLHLLPMNDSQNKGNLTQGCKVRVP